MDYLHIAQEVVRQAAAHGVEAEAYVQVGQETTVSVDRGQVEKLAQASSKGLGLRVFQDGRMGYAYTANFRPEHLARLVEQAVALCRVADPDPYRSLPDPQPIPDQDLAIFDPTLAALSPQELIRHALVMEQAALDHDPRVVMTNRCTVMRQVGYVALANSRGFAGAYDKTLIAGFLGALAQDDQDRLVVYHFDLATHLVDFTPTAIGDMAGRRAVGLLGGRSVPSQRATVVYSPYAAASIAGALARALTAEAMQRNRSFLQGQLGRQVASDVVTLVDNGRLPGGPATRPFDDEGVPTSATRVIDEGVLQAVLYDHYTARRDGRQSTGNAGRSSHRQPPSLAPSNFYFQPGNQSPEEILAGVERGLYVDSVMNTGSINPISGEYSVSARGYWIENGRVVHPVNEVTVAIPLAELLRNVRAVGNDLRFSPFGGAVGAPTLRVDGVMIGGR